MGPFELLLPPSSRGPLVVVDLIRQKFLLRAYQRAARRLGLEDVRWTLIPFGHDSVAYQHAAGRLGLQDAKWTLIPFGHDSVVGRKAELDVRVSFLGIRGPLAVVIAGATIPSALKFERGPYGGVFWDVGADDSPGKIEPPKADPRLDRLVSHILRCRLPIGRQDLPLSRIVLADGVLTVEVPTSPSGTLLEAVLEELLHFVQSLARPASLVGALRSALHAPDDSTRLEAAAALGREGHAQLRELVGRPDLDDALASRATRVLGAALGLEGALALLDRSIGRRPRTAAAALDVLVRLGNDQAIARVAEALLGRDAELAVAAATSLQLGSRSAAQQALISGLGVGSDRVRVAVADALRIAGSIAAVEPLQAAIGKRRLDLTFDHAAARAISAIQARAKNAEAGQLSLSTEAEAGQISLSPGEAGHVSLSDDD